jgi:hypothetical protein
MVNPPRPICLDEPCTAWEPRRGGYCGHQIVNGPDSCLYYDPEREQQRLERIKRKAMEGKK